MDKPTQPLISLRGIGRVFRAEDVETHALSGIELEIRSRRFLSIEGPSGCGKSTLLSILGLLDTPTSGSYTLDGRSVESLSSAERARVRRKQIGFIFQGFNLIGDLSVYENVELPLTYLGLPTQGAARPRGRRARARADEPPQEAHARPALGRPAAARRGGPSGGQQAADPAGRRAHRQPRLEERRAGDGAARPSCTKRARPCAWSPTIRATRSSRTSACACSTAACTTPSAARGGRRCARWLETCASASAAPALARLRERRGADARARRRRGQRDLLDHERRDAERPAVEGPRRRSSAWTCASAASTAIRAASTPGAIRRLEAADARRSPTSTRSHCEQVLPDRPRRAADRDRAARDAERLRAARRARAARPRRSTRRRVCPERRAAIMLGERLWQERYGGDVGTRRPHGRGQRRAGDGRRHHGRRAVVPLSPGRDASSRST